MEFTTFEVRISGKPTSCSGDYVKVTDGDGAILMDKRCGYSTYSTDSVYYFLPPVILTNTNTVQVFFWNNGGSTHRGWRLTWTAVTPLGLLILRGQ